MKTPQELLKQLGFTENEITVYISLLEIGIAGAGKIAKISKISRPTAYSTLETLIKRGLVSTFQKNGRTQYQALSPKRLLNYLEQDKEDYIAQIEKQKADVEESLAALQSIEQVDSDKPQVRFFEGEKGMREAYEDTLSAEGGILAYANVKTMHQGLINFFPRYYKRRTDAKVHITTILPRNKESYDRAAKDQEELRVTRFLPEGETFSPEINIYNNKVLIASWKERMAVIIESKEFADTQRLIFEQLWKTLPEE